MRKHTKIDPKRALRFMADPRGIVVVPPDATPKEIQNIRERLLKIPPDTDGLQFMAPRDAKPLSGDPDPL